MSVFVYMCVHKYAHVHICRAYVCGFIHLCICTFICIRMCVCARI